MITKLSCWILILVDSFKFLHLLGTHYEIVLPAPSVSLDIDTKIIFKGKDKSKPPKCDPDEQLIDGECVPNPCPKGSVLGTNGCTPLPPPVVPIFDESTPPNTLCKDEGDPDDCEEGFVDKGFGCVPIEDDGNEPPICTPDGPECPPCPEGVEAGWCADEDEQQDFDCDDSGMENDPRCIDRKPPVDGYVCDGSDVCGGNADDGASGAIPMPIVPDDDDVENTENESEEKGDIDQADEQGEELEEEEEEDDR